MAMLFGAMLAALATVYDKESGVMRMLVVAPFEHYWIVLAKVLAAAAAAIVQALMLLALLALFGFLSLGFSTSLLCAGLVSTSLACAALGMLIASWTKTLDNYAVVMNLVIFPVFFLSGSLYPVQRLPGLLQWAAALNPFTYGVDLLKHGMLLDGAAGSGPDFALSMDLLVLAVFIILACALACWRFSQEDVCEPLIHTLARHGKD